MSQHIGGGYGNEGCEEPWVDVVRLIAFRVKVGSQEAYGDVKGFAGDFMFVNLDTELASLRRSVSKALREHTNCRKSRWIGISPKGLGLRLSCRQ